MLGRKESLKNSEKTANNEERLFWEVKVREIGLGVSLGVTKAMQ